MSNVPSTLSSWLFLKAAALSLICARSPLLSSHEVAATFSASDMAERKLWEEYQKAYEDMIRNTASRESPWYVVESDVKKHARLNMMHHLLSSIEYHDVEEPKVDLPERPVVSGNYQRPPRELSRYVDDYAATLIES